MEKVYRKKQNIFVRNLSVIIAFIIPVLALIIMFAARSIYPFGEEMYLRSDMYHQYATMLKEFQSILKNGDSLLYTWNIGLGSDIPGTYAYYLATPVYWLVGLLPSTNIPEIMAGFIIIKAGLMSATFTWYIQKHTGRRSLASVAFGLFYAFSSYMAAYSWNLMWLDCLVLLPLITLGIERLVKRKRVILYTVSLAVAILSNYYISIMICIYLVMYFIYLALCEAEFKRFREFLSVLWRFALYSFLAALMAAITVLPALITLFSTASGSFSFPTTLRFYFNFLEMIAHATMNVEATVLSGYIPNIYCTIALFMLIPLFMMCRKISPKVKIGKAVLLLIFLFSFSMNIPTYIWHGFHYPNSLSSRQSFIYIFLILAMAYEIVTRVRVMKYLEITGCYIAGFLAIYGLQVLFGSEKYTLIMTSVSALFLTLYYIWMILKKNGRIAPVVMSIALILVALTEAMINTNMTGYTTTNRTIYMQDNADYTAMLSRIDDDGFYRVEKVTRRTKNDGAWLNYRSASEFSSTTLKRISDFYEKMGMQGSTNSFSYYGHTPLASAMLGVKYELASSEINDPLMTLVDSQNGYYLYENKYSLSLGYMVDSLFLDVYLSESGTPFGTQNEIGRQAADVKGLFKEQSSVSGETAVFEAEKTGRGYIYIDSKLKSVDVTIERDGTVISENTYSSIENKQLVDIGDVSEGDHITVKSNDQDVTNISVFPGVMDYDKLDQVINVLGEHVFDVDVFEDTYVRGTVTAENGQALLTSIPYSKGWKAYVDGQEAELIPFKKAFIAIKLEPGTHEIEFRYHSPGLNAAILISFFSIALFVFLCINDYRKNHPIRVKKPAPPVPAVAAAEAAETKPSDKQREITNDELSQMSARLAKISGELAKMSEKPLEK